METILVSTRNEANAVIEGLESIIKKYGNVTVADLYDLVGLSNSTRYSDVNVGWTSISSVGIREVSGRLEIVFPEAKSLIRFKRTNNSPFHDVLLVAFDVRGRSAEHVKKKLIDLLPSNSEISGFTDESAQFEMDSWWIADDENGTSDCDSAIFVTKGKQEEARQLLRENGLGN